MYGIAAVVAVLAVSLIAFAPMAQEAKANAANKNGFSSSTMEMRWIIADDQDGLFTSPIMEIESYYFKTSNDNNWLVDFTAECGTANHIKASGGKGKDKSQDTSNVSTKIFFTVTHPDTTEWLVSIDGTKSAYTGMVPDEEDMWNFCSQQFDIQVNLNDLIVSCAEAEAAGYTNYEAVCNSDTDNDGFVDNDPNKLVFLCTVEDPENIDECEQSIELFLASAGTRPAKAVLMDMPHGENEVTVYGVFAIDGTALTEDDFAVLNGGLGDGTSTWIGKRLLTIDTFHTDQSLALP